MTVTQGLLTAEEYGKLPDDGRFTELVRGRVVEMSRPTPQHGYYCVNISSVVRDYVRAHKLGRVIGNDSAVITERGPDTVRGPDVCFYSYDRMPAGPLPLGYVDVAPELVFEVRSPNDRWAKINGKIAEYLEAGVLVVCVLDPEKATLHVHRDNESPQVLKADDEFALPDILGDFRVAVRSFLE
jgi:Uma2 family endonuclease